MMTDVNILIGTAVILVLCVAALGLLSDAPPKDVDFEIPPHCDPNVLHAPGVCEICDLYPRRQISRMGAGINFTGEHQEGRKPCPSEVFRPVEEIELWEGNRPVKAQACTREPKHPGPCNGIPSTTCRLAAKEGYRRRNIRITD